ncbi:MAG: NAD-dependent deacylase [Verrucomicrobiae bacterium]|nr:NAD-dependent deacylase [Verrucomicrobiae bacterium]
MPRATTLTGAGMSAASGVPTFRGGGGLWEGHRVEEIATPEAFARDPEKVWRFYDERRQNLVRCRPNAGHQVLAGWSRRWTEFAVVTQNVDGLHEAAGTQNVIRLHGSLWDFACATSCAKSSRRWRNTETPLAILPPRCPHCGGLARPDIVWFGEALDPENWSAAADATRCDVFFTIGTSAVVQPAASLIRMAMDRGAYAVEINPEPTPATAAMDVAIRLPVEIALQRIEDAIAKA